MLERPGRQSYGSACLAKSGLERVPTYVVYPSPIFTLFRLLFEVRWSFVVGWVWVGLGWVEVGENVCGSC
jgi:hypothetical protein